METACLLPAENAKHKALDSKAYSCESSCLSHTSLLVWEFLDFFFFLEITSCFFSVNITCMPLIVEMTCNLLIFAFSVSFSLTSWLQKLWQTQ